MQGLSCFQHHQIGDVDDVIDRAYASLFEPLLQPAGRRGDLQPLQGRHAEQSAGFNRSLIRSGHGQWLGLNGAASGGWRVSLTADEGRHLPSDAQHGETVGPVGGDGQLQHLVIEAEARPNRRADWGHLLQQLVEHGDAIGIAGQPQLCQGADHAAAGHATQFGGLDCQVDGRQGGAHQGHRHVDAGQHVGSPADDLQRFRSPDIHLADAEFVGVGMGLPVAHVAHHHPLGLGRQIIDGIHLEPGHR